MGKLQDRAKQLKTDVPAVFFAMKERSTPWYAKALAALVVVYALSPIDLIPDFIPVLGYLDDLILLPALIACCVKCIPSEVFARCRESAAQMEIAQKQKWIYALPFLLIWLAVIALILLAIF